MSFRLCLVVATVVATSACQSSPSGDTASDRAGLSIESDGSVTSNGNARLEGSSLTFKGMAGARYSGPVPQADIMVVIRGSRLGVCNRTDSNAEYTCAMSPIDDRSSTMVGATAKLLNGSSLLYAIAFTPAPITVSTLHIPKGELFFTGGQQTPSGGWTNVTSWSLQYVPQADVDKLRLVGDDGTPI